jgi:hypothetical protein
MPNYHFNNDGVEILPDHIEKLSRSNGNLLEEGGDVGRKSINSKRRDAGTFARVSVYPFINILRGA